MKAIILSLTAAMLLGGAAAAQDAAKEPARDAQVKVRQACAADLKSLCPGKARKEARMCLRENAAKLSEACKQAIANAPRPGAGG